MSGQVRSAGRWWEELRAASGPPTLRHSFRPRRTVRVSGRGLVTAAVVRACRGMGWTCAAKHAAENPLPVRRAEYLGIDVLAFAPGRDWRRPVAAFELENSARDNVVAYALWKACTVQVDLACLLCYRRQPEQISGLIKMLQDSVLQRVEPRAEVLVAVGTRSAADTFPDGYFRQFRWDSAKAAVATMVRAG